MRIPGLAHEYERTCKNCGHAWRVPKWAVHPHAQRRPMPRGGQVVASGLAAAVVAANARLAERVAVYRRCPKCDSEHYKQRAVRS
jgi:hypothetical protein